MELDGYEGQVWAVGDCAAAKTVAVDIAAAMHDCPKAGFAFEGLGSLGALGHYSAVANIVGVRLSGLPAWFLWRGICL